MASGTLRVRAVGDFGDLNKKVQGVSGRLDKFGKKARKVGGSMSKRLTLPILAAGAGALKTAANFEQGMKRVEAKTGATGKSLGGLEKMAKKLGRTTQFSATQAADGMTFLAQAGFEVDEIMSAMPSMLNLAAVGEMELANAADIASNALTSFGLEASESERVADVLAKASLSANTDVTQMGEALKMVAPVAKSSGMSVEETAAAIGALSDQGIQGTMAGTSLRGVIAGLESPSKEAAKRLEEMGIQTHDAQGKMLPLVDIVGQFEDAGMSSADAMTIFGRRAGPAMLAMVGQGTDAIKSFTGELENAEGTAEKGAEKMREGLKGSLDQLKSAWEAVAIAIGESGLLEAVTAFADKMSAVFRKVSKTNPVLLKVGVIVAGVVAALGPLLMMIGMMSSGVAALIPALGKAGLAVKGFSSALLFLATNPIGLVVVAIGAAIGIALALWKNWDKVTAAVGKALSWLGDRFGQARDWIVRQLAGVIAKGVELMGWFAELPGRLWGVLQELAGRVAGFIAKYHPVAILLRKAVEFWPRLRGWFARLPGNIVSAMSALGRLLARVGKSALDALARAVEGAGRAVLNYFKNLPRNIVSGLGNLGRLLVSAGMDLMRGLVNGVKRMAGRVINSVTAPVKGAIDSAKRLLRIGSPSKVTEEIGRNVAEGFAGGMGQSTRLVKASAEGLARAAVPGQLDTLRRFGAGGGARGGGGGLTIQGNVIIRMEGGENLLSNDPVKRRDQLKRIQRGIQDIENEIR